MRLNYLEESTRGERRTQKLVSTMQSKYNTYAHVCTPWRVTGCWLRCELSDFHGARSGVCVLLVPHPRSCCCSQCFWNPPCSLDITPEPTALQSSVPSPTLQWADPAETPTTGLPFNPASILHVSFLLLVWQCSTARPRIVNRILGKRRAKLKASPDFRVHCRGGARRPAKAARDTVSKTIAKKPPNKILQVHVCYNATVT